VKIKYWQSLVSTIQTVILYSISQHMK